MNVVLREALVCLGILDNKETLGLRVNRERQGWLVTVVLSVLRGTKAIVGHVGSLDQKETRAHLEKRVYEVNEEKKEPRANQETRGPEEVMAPLGVREKMECLESRGRGVWKVQRAIKVGVVLLALLDHRGPKVQLVQLGPSVVLGRRVILVR